MRFRMPFSTEVVGLDIQPDAVRLVKAVPTKQGVEINQIATVALQYYVFNRDMVEHWGALKNALYELAITNKLRHADAVVSLPASLLNHGGIQDTYIKKYMECVKACGFKPIAIDLDISALRRVVYTNLLSVQQVKDILAIVHLQQHRTMLAVWHEGTMILQQTWWRHYQIDDNALWMNIEDLLSRKNIKLSSMLVSTIHNDKVMVKEDDNVYEVSVTPIFSCINDNIDNCAAYLTAVGLALGKL